MPDFQTPNVIVLVLLSVSFGIYGLEGEISPRVTEYVQIKYKARFFEYWG